MKGKVIAVAGGGTGGHVYPGLAVIEELKDRVPDCSVFWIGSGKGMEKGIVERAGVSFFSIPAGKLRRYFSLLNFVDLFKIAGGFFHSLYLLKKHKVTILFSKGGFVSVPPVVACRILKIPVVTHDSDLDPGLATRINSRFADKILVPYKESVNNFASIERVVVTGNPVRREILNGDAEEGRRIFNIPEGKKILLVLGGSLGALQLNNLIYSIAERLVSGYYIVHQMGLQTYKKSELDGYVTVPFLTYELPHILAAADLVVSRAGAGTLWESGVTGKASILIPLGLDSSRGDQIRNAEFFAAHGAAEIMKGEVTPQALFDRIVSLMEDEERRSTMSQAAGSFCTPGGAEKIAGILTEYVGE